MTNAERIKALRNCSDGFCSLCPYDDYELSTKECEAKLMLDAADALEAAEKKIAELMYIRIEEVAAVVVQRMEREDDGNI